MEAVAYTSLLRVRSELLATHLVLAGHPIQRTAAAFYFSREAEADLKRFSMALGLVRATKQRAEDRRISMNNVFKPADGGAR